MKFITANDIIDIAKNLNLNPEVDFENFDNDREFFEQGLNSIDIASLLFEIEGKFQIRFSDEDYNISEWNTINKIVEKVNELINN